jgi:hypothetical protein
MLTIGTALLGASAPALITPTAATAAGEIVLNGCATADTSAWETDSNGGSFGLLGDCPGTNPSFYPNGLSLGGGSASDGQYASWYTTVPAGMEINGVAVHSYYARGLRARG